MFLSEQRSEFAKKWTEAIEHASRSESCRGERTHPSAILKIVPSELKTPGHSFQWL